MKKLILAGLGALLCGVALAQSPDDLPMPDVSKSPAAVAAGTINLISCVMAPDATLLSCGVSGSSGPSTTLTLTWPVQNKNKGLFGPTTGADAAPTFRAMVSADVPTTLVSDQTAKAPATSADYLMISDSAASNVNKKVLVNAMPYRQIFSNPSTSITVGPSSTTESDIFGTQSSGTSIPGGTLGTSGSVIAVCHGIFLNNGGSNETITGRLYYGGTKMIDSNASTNIASSAGTRPWLLIATLYANAATNSQHAEIQFFMGNSTSGTTGFGSWANSTMLNAVSASNAAATIDSTQAAAFRVTLQNTNVGTGANIQWTSRKCTLYVEPGV